MARPKLYLFDLDSTLAVKWKPELLPGRVEELEGLEQPAAIVTNQGGVHARYGLEQRGEMERAAGYPTVETVLKRLTQITRQLPAIERAYVALYVGHDGYPLPPQRGDVVQNLETGVVVRMAWDPAWRKPAGGMLRQACCDFGVALDEALMFGDRDDDRDAARNANVRYVPVDEAAWEAGFLEIGD